VRLFEAAAHGTPIISDSWPGLETFFAPGEEILVARDADEVIGYLESLDAGEREALAARARARVLAEHTAAHRAVTLERYVAEARGFR
jgi:spore maturation protein CgeB